MTEQQILARMEDVAREHLAWNGPLSPSMDLISDLQLDSLRMLAFSVRMEECFGIEFDQVDGLAARTVGDLVDLIKRKVEPK